MSLKKTRPDDFWAAFSLAGHAGLLTLPACCRGSEGGFFATLSSPQLRGQGLVTQTFYRPGPEHVIFHPAMWVWSLDQVLLTVRV